MRAAGVSVHMSVCLAVLFVELADWIVRKQRMSMEATGQKSTRGLWVVGRCWSSTALGRGIPPRASRRGAGGEQGMRRTAAAGAESPPLSWESLHRWPPVPGDQGQNAAAVCECLQFSQPRPLIG